jgi:PhnB protein
MSATVKPIPDGYPRVSAYLAVDGAAAAIDFYASVLGATERGRMPGPGGTVGHAELQLGDSVIMLADESPDIGFLGPRKHGGSSVMLSVYVDDVDDTYARAIAAGATADSPVSDKFYGDRSGTFTDPWGHRWNVASHVEDVASDEMERRAAELAAGG